MQRQPDARLHGEVAIGVAAGERHIVAGGADDGRARDGDFGDDDGAVTGKGDQAAAGCLGQQIGRAAAIADDAAAGRRIAAAIAGAGREDAGGGQLQVMAPGVVEGDAERAGGRDGDGGLGKDWADGGHRLRDPAAAGALGDVEVLRALVVVADGDGARHVDGDGVVEAGVDGGVDGLGDPRAALAGGVAQVAGDGVLVDEVRHAGAVQHKVDMRRRQRGGDDAGLDPRRAVPGGEAHGVAPAIGHVGLVRGGEGKRRVAAAVEGLDVLRLPRTSDVLRIANIAGLGDAGVGSVRRAVTGQGQRRVRAGQPAHLVASNRRADPGAARQFDEAQAAIVAAIVGGARLAGGSGAQ